MEEIVISVKGYLIRGGQLLDEKRTFSVVYTPKAAKNKPRGGQISQGKLRTNLS